MTAGEALDATNDAEPGNVGGSLTSCLTIVSAKAGYYS